jgi:hypothetical protein
MVSQKDIEELITMLKNGRDIEAQYLWKKINFKEFLIDSIPIVPSKKVTEK